MPAWKEQLQQIQKLRLQQRLADEALYTTSINLIKTENVFKKLNQQETTLQVNKDEIRSIRTEITELQTQLLALDKEIDKISSLSVKQKENASIIHILSKKNETVAAQVTKVKKLVDEEQRNLQPDTLKLHSFQRQLIKMREEQNGLAEDLQKRKNEETILLQQEQESETWKQQLIERRKAIYNKKELKQKQLTTSLDTGSAVIDETRQKKDQLEQKKKTHKKALELADKDLRAAIEAFYPDKHPRSVINNLDDKIPFLLLPVRVETKFMTIGTQHELWLRIYPDDIAIHTHEKLLTDKEIPEGEKYWKAFFLAEKNGGDAKEDQKKNAWSAIATLFGSQRAAWIAKSTRPTNWSDDLAAIPTVEALIFPVHDLTKTTAWSRAPRTHVLPDKFVVMLYERGMIVHEKVGEIIPDELFVGPDPLNATDAFVEAADKTLVFGEAYNWTSDFEKAIQCGMGFKITLTPQQAINGFDKIVVLGAYLSADKTESKNAIEDLVDNHHYAPNGFCIVKQGTPTNNTELHGSGLSKNDPFNNTSYFVETGPPLFTGKTECDGLNLAHALGISYEPLQYIANSDATDHKEAVAMNKLLYPATLGYYFDTMMQPVLDATMQLKLRNFFTEHVSGRGPLPAIRVGNQPYGILLTSDFSKWKYKRTDGEAGVFLNKIYEIISRYNTSWTALLNKLMYVGKPGTDPSAVLLNILGLQPGSVSFFQRTAYTTDDLRNQENFKNGGSLVNEISDALASQHELLNFLHSFGYDVRDTEGALELPQLLDLVFQHYHTPLDAANLIDNIAVSETEGIGFYDVEAKKNYMHWLLDTGNVSALEKQDFGPGKKAPNSLLYLQLRRSLLLELAKASVKWFDNNQINVTQVLKPVNFHNIRETEDITKWEVMKAKISNALPTHPFQNKSVAEHLLTTGKNEQEAAYLNEMKKSLKLLADKSTASLERCFTEHLDTCTYRLDAWQSAIFKQRLQKNRKTQLPDGSIEWEKGIHIGSYSVLENLRPGVKKIIAPENIPAGLRPANHKPVYEYADNGGFVHAPSINHATAAAVLRSGYLNHASAGQPDTMAVNLSSERVRRAMLILEGIRNGQSLEALLGYQFERGLHDRASVNIELLKLNEYIYDFRDKFTISQQQVLQEGTGNASAVIPANNVVNGLTLSETDKIFPYGATGSVTTATSGEQLAIEAEKNKLADSLDAVKDLLLSESVFQMVQGNFDRTGAVMNALKDAQVPPEIEVVKQTRSNHIGFTNRVAVQFKPVTPADDDYNPWPSIPMTACAIMEAGMNNWIKKIIGEAGDLVLRVSHTDETASEHSEVLTIDKIGIQPIDIIYIIGNELNTGANKRNEESRTAASELESRIAFYYRQQKILDDDIPVRIQFMEPSDIPGKKTLGSILPLLRTMRSLISDSRNLHAQDYDPPSKQSMLDKTNPDGYLADELLGRVQQALATFEECLSEMRSLPVTKTAGSVISETSLDVLFSDLNLAAKDFEDIQFVFANNDALILQNILIRIADFRLPDSFPQVANIFDENKKTRLLNQAKNVARKMTEIIGNVRSLIDASIALPDTDKGKKIIKLTEAGKILFGDLLNIIPLFIYNNPVDMQRSDADRDQLLKYAKDELKMNFVAEEWLQQVAHVRPRVAKLDYIFTLHELFNGDSLSLKPVQLPYRSNDHWLSVQFPEKNEDDSVFNISDDTLSIIIQGEPATFTAEAQSGILVDEWTETIPVNEEITGLTFNYNQPNATPPQALLLAVPPQEKGSWDWDELVGIVNDTFTRAKLRAVEPALLNSTNKPELGLLLPAMLANFSEYDLDLALDYRTNVAHYAEHIPVNAVNNSIND